MTQVLQLPVAVSRTIPRFTAETRFQVYTANTLDRIPELQRLTEAQRFEIKVVASVLPFRVNRYVISELIDWGNIPDDPIFRLVFPQREMLEEADFDRIADALRSGASRPEVLSLARAIQTQMNPHPAGQQELNVPELHGQKLEGMQHKYDETVLFFPTQGQTCHSYCTFCFRWAQFVGDQSLKFAANEASSLHAYLRKSHGVRDLLLTGGDPMVMKTRILRSYLEPIAEGGFEHIDTLRIGTKSLTFWPQRYVTDEDADDVLRLFESLVKKGKNVAVMSHFNHWRELETPIVREAIRRIRDTGAIIRTQGPLLRPINNDPEVWARMWRTQVKLGLIPYYMFVERDTGAKKYFEVPLARAYEVYREAMRSVSGLARTARGPSMSAGPGKVEIQGIAEIKGEKVFVLRFIQGRNPEWVQRPFFAKYDPEATWLNQLVPAFGEKDFFFSAEYRAMLEDAAPSGPHSSRSARSAELPLRQPPHAMT